MKKALVLMLLFVFSLFAKTELSLSVGTNSFANKEKLDSATSLGIRSDFYLDDIYHLDFGYTYLGDVTISGTSKDIKIQRVYTQFSSDGKEEYHVVPTLSLGVGYEHQKGDWSDSSPFLSLGVGFRYNVSNSFNFLLRTKALLKTSSSSINYHTTFGIGYLIDEEPVNNKDALDEEIVIPEKKLDISSQFKSKPIKEIPAVKEDILDNKELIVTQVKQTASKLSPKPVVVKSSRGVYIQVAAYSKLKPRQTLDKLVRKGYHIVLRHQGSITKALVGPYSSRYEAQKVMPSIKEVVPKAFFYKGN